MKETKSEKVFVLGMDAMDPRFTKKLMDEGKMPNVKKLVERGACREDLVLLGGHPTVTPPMWTTLATGCYANVHGITDYYSCGSDIDKLKYGLDSRLCKAEPLWNVLAEAGKKTLVWHWPGCGWPPTSDSENLFVVDSTSPGTVGFGTGLRDAEFFVGASEEIPEPTFLMNAGSSSMACALSGLDLQEMELARMEKAFNSRGDTDIDMIIVDNSKEGTAAGSMNARANIAQSPIKEAYGWANAPEGAKELIMLLSMGYMRRPCLILKNADGIYDRVAVFKSKKEREPIAILPIGKVVSNIEDEALGREGNLKVVRSMKLMELDSDGSRAKIWVSNAMDIEATKHVCYPQEIYDELCGKFGYPPAPGMFGVHEEDEVMGCMLEGWNVCGDWQANCLNYMMKEKGMEYVFSHYHVIDMVAHHVIQFMSDKGNNKYDESVYEGYMEALYKAADHYIGQFVHLLDEGWTIMLLSDHGQICSKHELYPYGDPNGVSTELFEELGLCRVKRDENGNKIPEFDWEHTLAVAQRGPHIYLNLKSRSDHGIISDEERYEVEEKIITKLMGYTSKKTGNRIFSVVLRNRDAIHFGLGGPDCGDLIGFMAEGYSFDHGDAISTALGEKNTAVGPMFVAAGKGIKQGFITDRVIRQADVTPTIAALAGVRMPAQCEGAPIYQILDWEF